MSLEKLTNYGLTPKLDTVKQYQARPTYSGLQKLEESNFKGGTSIKYWM